MRTLIVALCLCASAFAQDTTATLEGQVTDPSGGVVAGAHVLALNAKTGYTRTQTTTSAGAYHLLVPVGEYTLEVQATNFASYTQMGIQLNVSQTARVDVALQLVTEKGTFNVTAEAPMLRCRAVRQRSRVFIRAAQI